MMAEPALQHWTMDQWAWNGLAMQAHRADAGLEKLAASGKAPKPRTGHQARCQVPGCPADLAGSRAYYRRYRICEAHFRESSMIFNGQVSRFCQQCAKFELLTEFDGDKRSCRRQLDRHNARRKGRKARKGGAHAGDSSDGEEGEEGAVPGNGDGFQDALAALLKDSTLRQSGSAANLADSPAALAMAVAMEAVVAAAAVPPAAAQAGMAAPAECPPALSPCSPQQPCMNAVAAAAAAVAAAAASPTDVGTQQHLDADDLFGPLDNEDACMALGDNEQQEPQNISEAAQMLLAVWQDEEDDLSEDSLSNTLGQAVRSGSLAPPPAHSPPDGLPNFLEHLADNSHPRSCDSSVHGPSRGGAPDAAKVSRVLEVLGASDKLAAFRADGRPLVSNNGSEGALASTLQDAAARSHMTRTRTHSMASAGQSRMLSAATMPPSMPGPAMFEQPNCGQQQQQAGGMGHAASMPMRMPAPMMRMDSHSSLDMSSMQVGSMRQRGGNLYGSWHSTQHNAGSSLAVAANMDANPGTQAGPEDGPSRFMMHQDSFAGSQGHTGMGMGMGGHMQRVGSMPSTCMPADFGSAGMGPGPMPFRPTAHMASLGIQWPVPDEPVFPGWGAHKDMAWESSMQMGNMIYSASPPMPMQQRLSNMMDMSQGHMVMQQGSMQQGPMVMQQGNMQQGGMQQQGPQGNMQQGNMGMQQGGMMAQHMSSQRMARSLGQANYMLAEASLSRLSIKLHGVTPDALPPDLRAALMEWLAATDVKLLQGFIRPGCVHLTLDCMQMSAHSKTGASSHHKTYGDLDEFLQAALLPTDAVALAAGSTDVGAGGAVSGGAALLPRSLANLFSSCTIVELQSPSQLVLMEGEAVWSVAPLDRRARPNLPTVHAVSPVVLLAGAPNQELLVSGAYLTLGSRSQSADGSVQLFVRSNGEFCQTGRASLVVSGGSGQQSEAGPSSAPGPVSGTWRVGVDVSRLRPGLAHVECQAGRLLSNARPVLVVDDPGVAAEVAMLGDVQAALPERVAAALTDLGLLLALRSASEARAAGEVAGRGGGGDQEDASSEVSWPSDGEDSDEDEHEGVSRMEMPGLTPRVPVPASRPTHVSNDEASSSYTGPTSGVAHWGDSLAASLPAAHTGDQPHVPLDLIVTVNTRTHEAPEEPEPAPDPFTPELRGAIAAAGLRVLAFAADCGWPCTLSLVMDTLSSLPLVPPAPLAHVPLDQLSMSQLVPLSHAALLSSCVASDGLTPLHRAARSGSPATARELLAIARNTGLSLNIASCGAASVSPLHIAAMAQDGGAMACTLLSASPDAPVQWFIARSAEGKTAAQCAHECGPAHINRQARMLVKVLAGATARPQPAATGGLPVKRAEANGQVAGAVLKRQMI